MIVLSSGTSIRPEDVEAHYIQSPFIRELCVVGVASPAAAGAERLQAIVVPDLEAFRARRIVNMRELIRFELEGLSVSLPGTMRAPAFEIRLHPLPRISDGEIDRVRVRLDHEAALERRDPHGNVLSVIDGDPPHVQRVSEAIRGFLARPAVVRAGSNLELDLGLDSMERVELIASLERQFGTVVSEDIAQRAFTVAELAEAFGAAGAPGVAAPGRRGGPTGRAVRPTEEEAWKDLLAESKASGRDAAFIRHSRFSTALGYLGMKLLVRALIRPRVNGLERLPKEGSYILCPNHQSYLDPFVLAAVLPFEAFRRIFSVGAAEYLETPRSAWLARQLNIVPVDPDANLLPAMQAAAAGLREGRVLVLFPEGERSIDGTVKTFRKGAGILSVQTGAPIVPVAIDGMFEIWPRGRAFAWKRLLPWSGGRVRIALGVPLPPRDQEQLRTIVESMWRDQHGVPHA